MRYAERVAQADRRGAELVEGLDQVGSTVSVKAKQRFLQLPEKYPLLPR